MKTRELEIAGLATMLVETRGSYQNTMAPMAGGSGVRPDHQLLAAIVRGPDANWFFKMVGPSSTVEEQRESFMAFLESLRVGS